MIDAARRGCVRLRAQSGLTLAETLVAATLLLVGALGTFALVDTANSATSANRAREAATNLGREVLEDARSVAYTKIGQPGWLTPQLQGLAGGSGSVTAPTANTLRTSVSRRGFTYTVTVAPCSLDDPRDGYGAHAAGTDWCSDSTTTGTSDGQPEDMKRVTATVTWSVGGRTQTLDMTAGFGSAGIAIGPTVSSLVITAPSGITSSTPTITTNPAGGIVTFRGAATGAQDMKFTVNGADQPTGVTNNGNGTWSFNWNIASLKDGTYTVAAVAIDALGTRGQPLSMQVTLNRNVPAALANPTGGYNYVYVNGTRTLVVEGSWDANTEGNVTGYEMLRGTTSVCGGSSSLSTSCIDLTPPSSGTTNYTIRTWYRDGAGNLQYISSTYPLTAPTTSAIPTKYYFSYDSANPAGNYTGSACRTPTGTGAQFDMPSTAPSFTARSSGSGWAVGCLPPFPSGISMSNTNMTFAARWLNSAGTDCTGMPVYVYLNGTTLVGGTGVNGGGTISKIAKSSTASSPATTSNTFKMNAVSFAPGDQLSVYTPAGTQSGCSGVSLYFNSSTYVSSATLPLSGSTSSLALPPTPTGLTATHNADGTTTLTWNAASGTSADFYRVYRDGKNYDDRVDTVGDDGTSATYSWTDSSTGGTAHTYYVTTATALLVESFPAGPVS